MRYQEKQKELFDKIESDFKEGASPSSLVKSISDYDGDSRACLTSVIFLPKELQEIIQEKVIKPLKKIDPSQHYYTSDALHITLQNIRTIHTPPLFTEKDVELAKQVFSKTVQKHTTFAFEIQGLFELPTSLALRCYSDEKLKDIRQEIMSELEKAGLADNKKYASSDVFFGNITVCRYTGKPNQDFFNTIDKLKSVHIGTIDVSLVFLVTTNVVCSPDKTTIFGKYNLKK